MKYFYIAVGGAFGSVARVWIDSTIADRMGTRFPYGTFFVNISASLLVGFAITFLMRKSGLGPAWKLLIPIGFLGAYSTFSTYEWETFASLRSGDVSYAALYAVSSVVVGLVAVACGVLLAEAIS